jgi:hypothetical protein
MIDQENHLHNQNIFHQALLTIRDKFKDIDFATDVYRALCNMQWQSIKDENFIYSCSWRYAGGLIAELRDKGEDYLDFYCSGDEGNVKDYIAKEFEQLGFKPLPYNEE